MIENADSVTLFLSVATGFQGSFAAPVQYAIFSEASDRVFTKPYNALLADHLADYQPLFQRVSLKIGESAELAQSTDVRVRAFAETNDPDMAVLLFQYGRYLMISSSRPGGPPANLQGIWNDELRPPWSSNYTININTQMNYWPVETANLAECSVPLIEWVGALAQKGQRTARALYNLDGWCAHHNSDIWNVSWPVGMGQGDPVWANWPFGGAWLCCNLWEHYAFSGDLAWAETTLYPLMKGAAQFCLGLLTENEDGLLVAIPSISPEHHFWANSESKASVSQATTIDMAIIETLFRRLLEAASLMGKDAEFADLIRAAYAKLAPPVINHEGVLQEWQRDFTPEDVHHRHVSHLFGLYPGDSITLAESPALYAAAQQALELRGDAGTGWSLAWKLNLWARLHNGNHAYALIRELIKPAGGRSTDYHGTGAGVYGNLFDAHPPFQIDGNFGYVSGVIEMLLQSHDEFLEALPALPACWPEGSARGLRARGGFVVDIAWQDGQAATLDILSTIGGVCRIKSASELLEFETQPGQSYRVCGRSVTTT